MRSQHSVAELKVLNLQRNRDELRLDGASNSARLIATIVGRTGEEIMQLHIERF